MFNRIPNPFNLLIYCPHMLKAVRSISSIDSDSKISVVIYMHHSDNVLCIAFLNLCMQK